MRTVAAAIRRRGRQLRADHHIDLTQARAIAKTSTRMGAGGTPIELVGDASDLGRPDASDGTVHRSSQDTTAHELILPLGLALLSASRAQR